MAFFDSPRLRWLVPPVIAVGLLILVTEAPYARGRSAVAAEHHYDGLIAYSADINAYFSFARQSAEGQVLFANRFAHGDEKRVFFNLEWLVVGWVMRYVGDPAVFTVWRIAGVVLLVFGFWTLAGVLAGYRERVFALALFCLGGGFGWVGELAKRIGVVDPDGLGFLSLDQVFAIHPFVQMLQNPHFSVPHGLILLALAFFVSGERTGRTSHFALAGLAGLMATLSRPYDLMAFFLVLPVFQLTTPAGGRRLLQRCLFLVILSTAWLPVLIIWIEPSYRPLAHQGVMPVLPLAGHFLALGVPAVLVVFRMVWGKTGTCRSPEERLLLLWGGAIFLLAQANRFIPALAYSPQFVVTSMGPLVLLATPLVGESLRRAGRFWIPAAILVLALPSSALTLSRRMNDASLGFFQYTEGERLAWEWLAAKAKPSDLIIATAESGNRLPRHVSAHVLTGHWTLSPDYGLWTTEAEAFFRGEFDRESTEAFLRRSGGDWIWIGPVERAMGGWGKSEFAPGCDSVYRHRLVRIFHCPPLETRQLTASPAEDRRSKRPLPDPPE